MRKISEVVKEMQKYTQNEEFIRLSNKVVQDSLFTAPESMWMRWNELHAVMMESLPSDLSQWTEDNWKMVSVFTTNLLKSCVGWYQSRLKWGNVFTFWRCILIFYTLHSSLLFIRAHGGTGRHTGLKIRRP